MNQSKIKKKKIASKKVNLKKPVYLREIHINYKKKRVKDNSSIGKSVTDSKQIVELFHDLQNDAKEKLITISLDSQLKIICFEVVAMGSVSTVSIRAFDVVRSPILVNAHGLIVIHNHPSGNPSPSPEDKKFTQKLCDITQKGGLIFHDHIIVGNNDYFSFSDKGLLEY